MWLRACLRIQSQRNDIIVLLSGRCMLGADGAEHCAAEHCVNAMLGVPWTLVLRLGPLKVAAKSGCHENSTQ